MGATDRRLTFRTYRKHVQKLKSVAEAHNLRINGRPSIGAALNLIIERYDASSELARVKKKGTKR